MTAAVFDVCVLFGKITVNDPVIDRISARICELVIFTEHDVFDNKLAFLGHLIFDLENTVLEVMDTRAGVALCCLRSCALRLQVPYLDYLLSVNFGNRIDPGNVTYGIARLKRFKILVRKQFL